MLNFLPKEKRKILLKYPFIKQYFKRKIDKNLFLKELKNFERQLIKEGITKEDIEKLKTEKPITFLQKMKKVAAAALIVITLGMAGHAGQPKQHQFIMPDPKEQPKQHQFIMPQEYRTKTLPVAASGTFVEHGQKIDKTDLIFIEGDYLYLVGSSGFDKSDKWARREAPDNAKRNLLKSLRLSFLGTPNVKIVKTYYLRLKSNIPKGPKEYHYYDVLMRIPLSDFRQEIQYKLRTKVRSINKSLKTRYAWLEIGRDDLGYRFAHKY